MYQLSVIMPIYNSEKFVRQGIESVLRQKESGIELILVDDGSTDGSSEICKVYGERYENIKYIHTENMGAGHARNIGIKAAKGEYIAFLDSDDLMLPDFYNKGMIKFLNECIKKQIDIIYGARAASDMNLTTKVKLKYPEHTIKHHVSKLEFCMSIYRKEYLIKNNIRFFEYREQDIETAFRYRAFVNTDKVLVKSDMFINLIRENMESNTHSFNYYNLHYIKAKVYMQLLKEQMEKNINDKETCEYLATIVIDCIYSFYSLFFRRKNERSLNKEINKEVKSYLSFLCEQNIAVKNITRKRMYRSILISKMIMLMPGIRQGHEKERNNKKIETIADDDKILERLLLINTDIMNKRK